MTSRIPILLSFYALGSSDGTLISGQLTYTNIRDLTFKDYSRRKTLRTLVRLYRTKPYANQAIELFFGERKVQITTDKYGSFYGKADMDLHGLALDKITLTSGVDVRIMEDLYSLNVDTIENNVIVISDIDDTLMHSFIYKKLLKLRTLLFTAVEKRRAVTHMQEVIKKLYNDGAATFYLSNSEQNLYPLIWRFLMHNRFPEGPVFLKKMRSVLDLIRNIKFPFRHVHKEQMLVNIMTLFPEKKFVLIGDNTQGDLSIYLAAAEKFPNNVRYVLVRKVVEKKQDLILIREKEQVLRGHGITLYYETDFPYEFRF